MRVVMGSRSRVGIETALARVGVSTAVARVRRCVESRLRGSRTRTEV